MLHDWKVPRAVWGSPAGQRSPLTICLFRPHWQPIALGAGVVVHATTKYLDVHSDVVGGAVIAADPEEVATLAHWANGGGGIDAPFDSYMTLRGVRTLFVRLAHQQANALAIVKYLRAQPRVSAVHYPGLADLPGHTIAASQQAGSGAMLSFGLRDGTSPVQRFVEAVEVFTLAELLGGVESLLAHPATMTHAAMGAEARRVAGISNGLLRLSVGLEAATDLTTELAAGFAAIDP